MKELIGKIVNRIFVSRDQYILSFELNDGTFISYITESDCCSETWFADIVGCLSLIKQPSRYARNITDVRESDMDWYNVNDGRERQDYDQAYGYTIFSNRGTCKIAFRNSSNGYYGGYITLFEGELPSDMIEITEDEWSA